jgi:hypothetical protein
LRRPIGEIKSAVLISCCIRQCDFTPDGHSLSAKFTVFSGCLMSAVKKEDVKNRSMVGNKTLALRG